MEHERPRTKRSKLCGHAVGVRCCCRDDDHDESIYEPRLLDVTEFMAHPQRLPRDPSQDID